MSKKKPAPKKPIAPRPLPLRLEYRRPSELAANPANWKTHPESQLLGLGDVIGEVGWAGAVLFNEATGRLIDGHARKEFAEAADEPIPVLIGSWTEAQELLILATLDPLASMAEVDAKALEQLLATVETSSAAINAMLDDLAKQHAIDTDPNPEPGAGGDEFDPTPVEEGPTRTQVGDMWLIGGKHRLLVGDSTKGENMIRLMGGQKAEMVWTDPPYGVSIGDKNKYLNKIAPCNRIEENLANDNIDEAGIKKMLDEVFDNAVANCLPGAAWYVAAPARPLHLLFAGGMKERGILRQMLIWVKNNATFSPMGVSYHWRHEPIFYGWLPNGGHRYHGDRKQDTCWEVDRPQTSADHPTMKPLELVERAISHSSLKGEIVLDPFLGSGTTLIAAHRLGRVCYGMELEPRYADVILKRAEAEGMSVIKGNW